MTKEKIRFLISMFFGFFLFGTIFLCNQTISAQSVEKEEKSVSVDDAEKEAKYIAPLRYVIVYNDIWELTSSERRVEIVMDEKQFNEKNLITLFDLIKKRFPTPQKLNIEVHTNLATIETPEEKEMIRNGHTGRLDANTFIYKTAFYNRFNNGREAFIYTTSIKPFADKLVVLVDKSLKK